MTKGPEILAKCEVCDHEWCMHPLEDVRLVDGEHWMCLSCYGDDDGATREGWLRIPQASEWVAVREVPAEKQLCLHSHGVSANNRCLNCGKDME